MTAAAETVSPDGETQAADGTVQTAETGETSGLQEMQGTESAVQNAEEEQEGLSDTAKHLLIAGGCMGVLLIILLIALYIKNG